jgi:flagellar hook-associated protein 2
MSTITPLRFTGISTFSDDFQTIVDRTLSIAKLPVQAMQNQQMNVISKKQALSALAGNVRALAEAVAVLAAQGSNQGLGVSSSSSKVSVSLAGATEPASYTISNVTSLATRASEATETGLATSDATAVDSDNLLELVFDGQSYALDLTAYGNNLGGLRDAIKAVAAQHSLDLTVSIVNTGEAGAPYHLAISATESGNRAIQLWTGANATGTNLLTAANPGSNAEFELNGVPVSKKDNFINDLIPGVNLTLLSTTPVGESISVDLSSSRQMLRSGLESFVAAYNSLTQDLNSHIGENAGMLTGDMIVSHTKSLLRQMVGYDDSGTIGSLAALGVELDTSGKMSLNPNRFAALSNEAFADAFRFLGSETSGFGGFVQRLDAISHPLIKGMIEQQQQQYDATDRRLESQIGRMIERIEFTQNSLLLQLQQSDSLLAMLEGQQRLLDASLEAVNYAMYGRKDR